MLTALRSTLRGLLRTPVFTAASVLLLGLGLGVGLALFNGVQAVLWRSLPFRASQHLVTMELDLLGRGFGPYMSLENGRRVAEVPGVKAAGLVEGLNPLVLEEGADLPRVAVNADFFQALDRRALVGRLLGPEDEAERVERPVVLTEEAWRGRFGSDPSLVGKLLPGLTPPTRVVGVLAGREKLPFVAREVELFEPLSWRGAQPGEDLTRYNVQGVLRTDGRPGIREALEIALRAGFEALPPWKGQTRTVPPFRIRTLRDVLAPQDRSFFLLNLGLAASLVVLVAINVAGLFLARTLARRREEALRAALGATWGQTLGRNGLEAFVVSGAGLAIGLGLERLLRPLLADQLPELAPLGSGLLAGGPTLATVAILLLAFLTLSMALLPAFHLRRMALASALAAGGHGSTARRGPWPDLLVGAQAALVLVLLVCSGLLGRSLARALATAPGFKPEGLLVVGLKPPRGADIRAWGAEAVARTQSLPGVERAALVNWPLFGPAGVRDHVFHYAGGPGAAAALGAPLLHGRDLGLEDGPDAAVISRKLALTRFGTVQAAGRILPDSGPGGQTMHVVGVISDLRVEGLDREPPLSMLRRGEPETMRRLFLLVRTPQSPEAFRSLLASRLPGGALKRVERATDLTSATVRHRMRLPALALAFSFTGMALACAGLWASVGDQLRRRRRELALRSALGAEPAGIGWGVLRMALLPVTGGALSGLLLALPAARLLQDQLYAVQPRDPAAFLSAFALLLLAGLVTALAPAFSAIRINLSQALRSE